MSECRVFAHWWKPYDAFKAGPVFIAELRCQRCSGKRIDVINSEGRVIGRRYRYAKGYLRVGNGPLTGSERGELRLAALSKFQK